MGSGIAQVCAEAGHDVIVREVSDAALAKGLGSVSYTHLTLPTRDLV